VWMLSPFGDNGFETQAPPRIPVTAGVFIVDLTAKSI